MNGYVDMRYVESGTLVEGWSYRIHRAIKQDGTRVYTGLLSQDALDRRGRKSFVCLAEYPTLEEARAAAYQSLPPRVQAHVLAASWCSRLWPAQAQAPVREFGSDVAWG